jgi:hypothetical protein
MTPRERIRAVLLRQQPDRVPRMTNFYPTAFGPHPGRPSEVEFETDIRFVTLPEPEEQIEFMRYLKSLPADTYVGSREILRTYHDWGYHPEIERDARLHGARQARATPLQSRAPARTGLSGDGLSAPPGRRFLRAGRPAARLRAVHDRPRQQPPARRPPDGAAHRHASLGVAGAHRAGPCGSASSSRT